MPTVDSFSTYRPVTPIGVVLGRFVAKFDTWLAHRRERAELLSTLHLMGDRDLHDLGISRADFPAIVEGSYRR